MEIILLHGLRLAISYSLNNSDGEIGGSMIVLLILSGLLFGSLHAEVPTLTAITQNALEHNHDLQALAQKLDALQLGEYLSRQSYNPMVMIEYSNVPIDSWQLDESAMSGVQVKLQQTVVFPGKNSLRRQISTTKTEYGRHSLQYARRRLVAQISRVWAHMALLNRLESISREHLILLNALQERFNTRLGQGNSMTHEVLRVELKRATLEEELQDFITQRQELEAQLQAVTQIDSVSDLHPDLQDIPVMRELDEASLKQLLLTVHPQLLKQQEIRNQHQLERTLSARERWPDVTLWAGYRYRRDTPMGLSPDLASIGVSFPIPLEYTNRSGWRRRIALANEAAAGSTLRDAEDTLLAQLSAAIARWLRWKDKTHIYHTMLIPQSQATLDAVRSAFSQDTVEFTALIQAQQQVLDYTRKAVMAKYQLALAQIAINELTQPLEGEIP